MSTSVRKLKPHLQPRSWRECSVCSTPVAFKTPADFSRHLREWHCAREGGSFVCKYGYNGVCSSLPVEGVSDCDYEGHVARHHVFLSTTYDAQSVDCRHPVELDFGVGGRGMSSSSSAAMTQPEWTVYSSTQNLPAVLNDPRTSKPRDIFTKTWGDSFVEKTDVPPCSFLPEITHGHFEGYLKKIARRHRRNLRRTSSSSSSTSSSANRSLVDEEQNDLRRLQATRTQDRVQAELESIPKIFLQPSFSLESMETFNVVFPCIRLSQGRLSNGPITHLASSSQQSARLLQEQLSHHLDIVEVQIARHVSQRSGAFFHAMTSHDALMEQLVSTVDLVKVLRERVHRVDDVLVKGSLHVMKLKHTRQVYVGVYKKLRLMSTVHQTQPTIQLLLSTSDFVGALDLISTTREVLDQELADIHCFRHLGSQLAELEKVIDKMTQTDFLRYAIVELSRTLDGTENTEDECNGDNVILEEERLVAIVFGMLRRSKHAFVNVIREEAFNTIKTVVRQSVVEVISKSGVVESEAATPVSLADQLRLLDFKEWLLLVDQVFKRLLKLLLRIKAMHSVMADTVDVAAGHCPAAATVPTLKAMQAPLVRNMQGNIDADDIVVPEDVHLRLSSAIKDTLISICDYADDRSAKLFAAKSKDGFFEKLTVAEFVVMTSSVDGFVSGSGTICGKRSTNLHLALQSQAHRFVTRFHEERKTKLGLILDSELWKQADVPRKFQELVDHIATSESLCIPKRVSEMDLIEDKKTSGVLLVKGEKYAVIGTVLMLLNMVLEYCDCVIGLPYISADILTRLVELLKTYNSRSCQLVLGAGALQLVGLKTITTKNLALASRCLQLMTLFIPRLRSHFEQYLPPRQSGVVKQLDQVLKDYNDHVNEIANKLVAIMDSMFETQLSKWEVKPPVPSPGFRAICKQLNKLHEAIADVLPIDQVQKLFLRINTAFKGSMKRHLQRRIVVNDGGPQHGLVTSELAFYVQSLKSTDCIRDEKDLGMDDIWIAR